MCVKQMVAFPSKVLVIADYDKYHFGEEIRSQIDFVLACGDIPFHLFGEIYERFKIPIFAVKGNHDPTAPFPDFVKNVHNRMVQHRRWLIGGWQGVPHYKSTGPYEWDDMGAAYQLSKFPYVDIFICHAPMAKMTDKADYAHAGSEAILKYIEEKQPRYVYHGHVHSKMGTMIGKTAVVSVFGAKVVTLS
jgi:Icc-related predicted phosphoesterase